MKDVIIAKFKAKFPAVNLRKKRLDDIAAKLSTKITDEAEIDTKLDELNEIFPFSEIAAQDDAFFALKKKVPTETPANESPNQSSTTTTNTDDPEAPAWAKGLIESNQQLSLKLAAMEKEKFQQGIQQKVTTHEKLKGINPVFYKGRALPEKEDDLETFVDGIKTDYDAFVQQSNTESLVNGHKPISATGVGNKTPVISSDMKSYLESKKAEATQNKN